MKKVSGESEDGAGFKNRLVRKPIFVVGCPRSGTTLLGHCLGAHSGLVCGDESLFIAKIAPIFSYLHQGKNKRGWAPLREYIGEAQLLILMQEFADGIIGSFLSRNAYRQYVDHTPWYVRVMPFITQIYPDAKFIHVIRDGRDVALSLAASYQMGYRWAGRGVRDHAALWLDCVAKGRLYGSAVGRDRYHELFYEDLCRAPEESLRHMLEFVDLPFESQVLLPLAAPHARPSRKDRLLAVTHGAGVEIYPRESGGTWPSNWNEGKRNAFLEIAGGLMVECGYRV